MQVWIRVYAWINPDSEADSERYALLVPSVAVEVYRTQDEAEADRKTHGGIVVETTAASLRGSVDGHAYIDYTKKKTERFVDRDKPTLTLNPGPSLPHVVKRPQGDTSIEFTTDDARQWVEALEQESGLVFTL